MTRCRSPPSYGLRADCRMPGMAVVLTGEAGHLVANHPASAGSGETSDVKIAGTRVQPSWTAPETRSSRRRCVRQGGLTTKLGRASRTAIVSRRKHFAGQIPLQLNDPSTTRRNARLSSREAWIGKKPVLEELPQQLDLRGRCQRPCNVLRRAIAHP